MHVVVVTEAHGWGGTEVNTIGLIEALAAAGHEVTHLQVGHDAYRRLGPPPVGTYRTVSLPTAPYDGFSSLPLRWWLRVLREYRPDVCALAKGWFGMQSPAFDVAARLAARRYVVLENHPTEALPPRTHRRHLGGLVPGLGLWWWREVGRAYAAGRIHTAWPHRVVASSQHVVEVLHTSYGLARDKTRVVYPGVEPAAFNFRPAGRAELRARWGVPPDALVLGSVGRLEGIKGLDRSIRTFVELRRRLPEVDAWLLLAGTGSQEGALRAQARDLGVADRVLIPGYVADATDALSALDVFLLPSYEEGFGIALIEAMACERVCVAMNSGGPQEILTRPCLGWLTPANDEAAFTQATLAAAALDADARRAMGREARAHVEQRFDHSRQIQRVAELVVTA